MKALVFQRGVESKSVFKPLVSNRLNPHAPTERRLLKEREKEDHMYGDKVGRRCKPELTPALKAPGFKIST